MEITVANIIEVNFSDLMKGLHDIYSKEVPEFAIDKTFHLTQLEKDLIYFSNQYAYIMELWAIMTFQVRALRHRKANRSEIDEAIDKRDYLDKVLSTIKLKYHALSRLLMFHQQPDYKGGY